MQRFGCCHFHQLVLPNEKLVLLVQELLLLAKNLSGTGRASEVQTCAPSAGSKTPRGRCPIAWARSRIQGVGPVNLGCADAE